MPMAPAEESRTVCPVPAVPDVQFNSIRRPGERRPKCACRPSPHRASSCPPSAQHGHARHGGPQVAQGLAVARRGQAHGRYARRRRRGAGGAAVCPVAAGAALATMAAPARSSPLAGGESGFSTLCMRGGAGQGPFDHDGPVGRLSSDSVLWIEREFRSLLVGLFEPCFPAFRLALVNGGFVFSECPAPSRVIST